jgi:hypothetical protein
VHGIGITDPQPDKDGTWWMAIQHDTAMGHSGKYVQRWDAEVHEDRIAVRALVVLAGSTTRAWYGSPELGAHIARLAEGDYQVVYLNRDGTESLLGHVTARRSDHVPAPILQWSEGQRHNKPIKLAVRAVTPLAVASVAPAQPAAYRQR